VRGCVFGWRYSFLGRRLGIGCGGGIPWSLFGQRKEGVVVCCKFFFSKFCAPRVTYMAHPSHTPFSCSLKLTLAAYLAPDLPYPKGQYV
jgi:hypothetical protein